MTISVDYAGLDGGAQQMKQLAGQMEQAVNDLKTKLGALVWEGEDYTAYQAQQDKMDQSIIDIKELLEDIAKAVGQANEAYQGTEKANAQSWA